MTKIQKWSVTRRVRSLEKMGAYVEKHAEKIGVEYWHDEISGLSTLSASSQAEEIRTEEIYKEIALSDEKFADALFIFYIAVTTSTKWLQDIAKAFLQ